jgi:hypothetical protein
MRMMPANAILVALAERVHERPPLIRQRQDTANSLGLSLHSARQDIKGKALGELAGASILTPIR